MTSRSTAKGRHLQRGFVERAAATGADLLTTALSAYVEAESIDWLRLTQEIGCDIETLDRIACCRWPRLEQFAEDCHSIAIHAGVDPFRLLAFLRKLAVIREFTYTERSESATRYTEDQMLLAARDHEPGELSSSEGGAQDA